MRPGVQKVGEEKQKKPILPCATLSKNRAMRSTWAESRLTGRLLTPVQGRLVEFPFGRKIAECGDGFVHVACPAKLLADKKCDGSARKKAPAQYETGASCRVCQRLADTVVEHTAGRDLFQCYLTMEVGLSAERSPFSQKYDRVFHLGGEVPIDTLASPSETFGYGEAISPSGDMPKNRVRFSEKDAACPPSTPSVSLLA